VTQSAYKIQFEGPTVKSKSSRCGKLKQNQNVGSSLGHDITPQKDPHGQQSKQAGMAQ